MTTSYTAPPDRKAWAAAFTKAQADFPPIPKGKTVNTGSFSYKYADLPTILELVNPVLAKHGLAIGQAVVSEDGKVGVTTHVYHNAGHVETFGPVLLPAGKDAQSAGSAITYARRYSLCAALGIAADEDDDGAAASPRTDNVRTQPKAAQPVSQGDPHCPACLVLTGEFVGVNRLQGGDKKPWWKCVKGSDCADPSTAKNGRKYGWSGWHDSFQASSEEWLQKNGYEGTVAASAPDQDAREWLAVAVKAFSKWSDDQRRQAYKAVMEELNLTSLEDLDMAKAIYEGMAESYYAEYPDLSPF